MVGVYVKWPAYREPGFEVVAFPHGLVAFATDEEGKHLARMGDTTKPPHWGIWRGIVCRSACCPPEFDEMQLMDLLVRGQKALRCKEEHYEKRLALLRE